MTNSKNSKRGRKNASPSRQLCSCNDPDCDVKRERGKHKQKKVDAKKKILNKY
jgi:hypothetical protein